MIVATRSMEFVGGCRPIGTRPSVTERVGERPHIQSVCTPFHSVVGRPFLFKISNAIPTPINERPHTATAEGQTAPPIMKIPADARQIQITAAVMLSYASLSSESVVGIAIPHPGLCGC